jgi:N-acetylglutamate synthase-like GNAT family acetyltransferase
VAEISHRQASLDDAAEIHTLLLALAPEIPLRVDTLEREEALYVLIRNCARSGESWVAIDDSGRIIGVVLVEPSQLRRHYAEGELLEMRYAGVLAEWRNRGIFGGLIEKTLARMLPVTMTVNPQNRSGISQRLEKHGFRQIGAAGGEQRLRWEPGGQ